MTARLKIEVGLPLIITASKRTVTSEALQINVILQDHDVADVVTGIEATSRVRNDQMRYSHQFHNSHGHGALFIQNIYLRNN